MAWCQTYSVACSPPHGNFLAFSTHAYCMLHSEATAFFEAELDSLLFTNFTRYFLDILYQHYKFQRFGNDSWNWKNWKISDKISEIIWLFCAADSSTINSGIFWFFTSSTIPISWFKNPEKQIAITFPINKPQHSSLMKSLMKYKSRLDSSQNIQ